MSTQHNYETTARWTIDREGILTAGGSSDSVIFSSPPEFQGRAGLWSPEHLLLGAVAGCFMTTFLAIAEISKLAFDSLEVEARGSLGKPDGAFRFTDIQIRPCLTVLSQEDRERALRLLEKAGHSCIISRSLRPEITIALEPVILVVAPLALGSAIGLD